MSRAGTIAVPYLRAWREYKLLSRAALAAIADITEPAIEKLEMGRSKGAHFSTVKKIADALAISTDDLLYTEPRKHGETHE